jgi:SAM-dependent methyltransferase
MTRDLDVDADPLARALRAAVRPTDRVLDVGAGAGRYTFAVAPLVEHVTAVEPSGGMRTALAQQAAARQVRNVTVVPTRWEEAAVEPHDLAFVSSVLYFVADAVPFLEKLDQSARRACYIFHRVVERAAVLGPDWQDLAGRRPQEPGFLDLYNLLFAMGIRANAHILRSPPATRFGGIDEALAEARRILGKDPDDHRDDEDLRAFLAASLVRDERGLRFPGVPETGMIWWEKEE